MACCCVPTAAPVRGAAASVGERAFRLRTAAPLASGDACKRLAAATAAPLGAPAAVEEEEAEEEAEEAVASSAMLGARIMDWREKTAVRPLARRVADVGERGAGEAEGGELRLGVSESSSSSPSIESRLGESVERPLAEKTSSNDGSIRVAS